jgi:hypothetical protein
MRYMATLYVSDVMDQVAATVELLAWEEMYGPPETVYEMTHTWPGLGLDDPRAWLLAALRGICADMSKAASRRVEAAEPLGGSHTLSETGDKRI